MEGSKKEERMEDTTDTEELDSDGYSVGSHGTASSLGPMALPTPQKNHLMLAFNADTFAPGSQVEGVVVLVIQDEDLFRARSLKIQFTGKESTKWYQGSQMTVLCTEQRTILDEQVMLWNSAVDGRLHKGTHTFNFSWKLDVNIPGSFVDSSEGNVTRLFPWVLTTGSIVPKSLYGDRSFISYSGKAFIEEEEDIEHKGIQLQTEGTFNVVEQFDADIMTRDPVIVEVQKNYLFSKEILKMKASILRNGTGLAGYRLPMDFEVLNGPNKTILGIRLEFYKKTTLRANGETFYRRTQMFNGRFSASEPTYPVWNKRALVDIPEDSEPSVTHGTLISVEYEVAMELEVSGVLSNLSAICPLQIFAEESVMPSVLRQFTKNNTLLMDSVPHPVPSTSGHQSQGEESGKEETEDIPL